jgi:hypothetical protein
MTWGAFNPRTVPTYKGISTDPKPVLAEDGALGLELDTGIQYIFDVATSQWWSDVMAAGYSLLKVVEILTGTTVYTPTTGARALFVECVGGGGAGGSAANAATNAGAAGGGGAGAYAASWLSNLHTSPYTVAVGAGGTAGGSGAHDGGNGADTTFDSPAVITAKLGSGGKQRTVTVGPVMGGLGGAGGLASASTGDMKTDGASGGAGFMLAAAQAISGAGGASIFGGGAAAVASTTAGLAAGSYGAGGSGACIISGGADQNGGAGGAGVIRVWEFA